MLRRAVASIDASDIVIGGALLALGLGVTLKFDYMTGLIAAAVATLSLIAIGFWKS